MLDRDRAIAHTLSRMAREDRPRHLVAYLRYQKWLTLRGQCLPHLQGETERLDAPVVSQPVPTTLLRDVMGGGL